jgi:hypothetical protein
MRSTKLFKVSALVSFMALAGCGAQDKTQEQQELLSQNFAEAPADAVYTAPTVDITSRSAKPKIKTGRLREGGPIQGARYVSTSKKNKTTSKGVTGADGSFKYSDGDTVTFYVGDVLLGKVVVPASGVVTPVSITKEFTQADALANMLRFLQTIDADNTPWNGIQLKEGVGSGMQVNFNLAAKDFKVQQSLLALLASFTNSNNIPGIQAALISFRDSMLNAYNTSGTAAVLNLVNTKWNSTFTNEACSGSSTATRRFTAIGPVYTGSYGVLPNPDGTCKKIGMALFAGFYEHDNIFSCAKGCKVTDLNKTVTLSVPYPHTVHVAHEPNSGVITIVHEYKEGTIVETMKKI